MDFKIILDLDKKYIDDNKIWIDKSELAQLAYTCDGIYIGKELSRDFSTSENIVVISDEENASEIWKNMPVIGVEHKCNIYNVQYVVENVRDIDRKFLEKTFCRKKNLPVTICETEHLLIREMSTEDLSALIELYENTDCSYIPRLRKEEMTEAFVTNYIENMYEFYDLGLWLVLDKATGKLIGRGGIEIRNVLDPNNKSTCEQRYELAYMIRNDYCGRGFGTELLEAVVKEAQIREIDNPIVYINDKNIPSIKVAERAGFVRTTTVMDGNDNFSIYELKNVK